MSFDWRAANRDQELVSPHLALLRVDAHSTARFLGALHLDSDPAIYARLLEGPEHLLRDLLILQRHQAVEPSSSVTLTPSWL